jgi:hypothetical protein
MEFKMPGYLLLRLFVVKILRLTVSKCQELIAKFVMNCPVHDNLRVDLEKHAGKICICELEMPLVIELIESRAEWVVVFQMKVMHFGFRSGVPTIFTYIHL